MSGREVCRSLKAKQQTRAIPSLLLSAQEEPPLAKLVEHAGAERYIPVPYEGPALIERIRIALGTKRRPAALRARHAGLLEEEVVIEAEAMETRLLVDDVAEVVTVPLSRLEPPLSTLDPERAAYIEQTCRVEERLIAVLQPDTLRGQGKV